MEMFLKIVLSCPLNSELQGLRGLQKYYSDQTYQPFKIRCSLFESCSCFSIVRGGLDENSQTALTIVPQVHN
eukprot:6057214-Amphidinium_carterae.1